MIAIAAGAYSGFGKIMRIINVAFVFGLSLALAACFGSSFSEDGATIGQHSIEQNGPVNGSVVLSVMGGSLTEIDQRRVLEAEYRALETGRKIDWINPSSGTNGKVIPAAIVFRDGSTCRDFEHVITTSDRTSTLRALGCKTDEGKWKITRI